MKKLLCGLAALPLLSAPALAAHPIGGQAQQPIMLSDTQLEAVTAGWRLSEIDLSNTSWTRVEVYTGVDPVCSGCYLDIDSRAISIDSKILGGL